MSKKISVMMAFVCNPYLAVLQKKTYLKYWKDEVDEVLINVNGRNERIRTFIEELWADEKVVWMDNVDWEMRQGAAFDRLYPHATGEVLMTMDSDNFVYRTGSLSKFRDMILTNNNDGQYDAIGSTGLHAYPVSVAVLAQNKYRKVRYNPFMSFWRRSIVNKIPKEGFTFGTYNYVAGTKYKPLGEIKEDGWMDVMSKFSLDFFAISDKTLNIPQTVNGEYMHMTGISSIFRRKFKSLDDDNEQKFRETALAPWHNLSYWVNYKLLYEATKNEVPEWFNKEYKKGLDIEIAKSQVTERNINALMHQNRENHKGLFDL